MARYFVARAGAALAAEAEIVSSVVGAVMTETVASLPELLTSFAAVRRGALRLAVSRITGGNAFGVLFLFASDAAYRDGLLFGMIRREDHGIGNLGFESLGLLVSCFGPIAVALIRF